MKQIANHPPADQRTDAYCAIFFELTDREQADAKRAEKSRNNANKSPFQMPANYPVTYVEPDPINGWVSEVRFGQWPALPTQSQVDAATNPPPPRSVRPPKKKAARSRSSFNRYQEFEDDDLDEYEQTLSLS